MSTNDKTAAREAAKALAMLNAAQDAEATALADAAKRANSEAVRNATFEQARIYGAESATGSLSVTKLAYLYNEAVRQGTMSLDDAARVYKAYVAGFNEVVTAGSAIEINGVSYQAATDRDAQDPENKTPISMFRTFGKPAVVAQGLGHFQRVLRLRAEVSKSDLYGSAYSCMVKVNREIISAADKSSMSDKDVAAGKQEVTDAMIVAWMTKADASKDDGDESATPEEKAKKSAAEKLDKLIEAANKLAKTGEVDGLAAVVETLREIAGKHAIAVKAAANGAPQPKLELVKKDAA